MADIVVAGGGFCGMTAAMMLARDGHHVTMLERDAAPLPATIDEAWESWDRRSLAQFRMAHMLLSRGYSILSRELPDVADRLRANGGLTFNLVELVLATIDGAEIEPDDHQYATVTGRRPMLEWVCATALADEPRVTVRRGAVIDGLLPGTEAIAGVPHVAGVRLAGGEELRAELVIDATGRRSPTPEWIAALGARAPEEVAEDSGFSYFGRFFKSPDGSVPAPLAPLLSPIGTFSVLCIPSDNGTWSTTLYSGSADVPLRRFRDADVFEKVISECPLHVHWLDGEPICDVRSMSGVVDRVRHFVVDGVPVATGILSVADAYACTNPSLGRGMTLGLMHTVMMRDTVRQHLDDPAELPVAFHAATVSGLDPWHAATRDLDRARNAEMRALAAGEQPAPDPTRSISAAVFAAGAVDARAARWLGEIIGCHALPADVLAREGVFEHVLAVTNGDEPQPIPGPDRQRLLELVA